MFDRLFYSFVNVAGPTGGTEPSVRPVISAFRQPRWSGGPRTTCTTCSALCVRCALASSTPATSSTLWRTASWSASRTTRPRKQRVSFEQISEAISQETYLPLLSGIGINYRCQVSNPHFCAIFPHPPANRTLSLGWVARRRIVEQTSTHNNHRQAAGDAEERLQQQPEAGPARPRATVPGHGAGHAGGAGVVSEPVRYDFESLLVQNFKQGIKNVLSNFIYFKNIKFIFSMLHLCNFNRNLSKISSYF